MTVKKINCMRTLFCLKYTFIVTKEHSFYFSGRHDSSNLQTVVDEVIPLRYIHNHWVIKTTMSSMLPSIATWVKLQCTKGLTCRADQPHTPPPCSSCLTPWYTSLPFFLDVLSRHRLRPVPQSYTLRYKLIFFCIRVRRYSYVEKENLQYLHPTDW